MNADKLVEQARARIKGVARVITHGADMHSDDFLAVGLARFFLGNTVPVERRYPTEDELNDPRILILDVGKRLEPEKNNFDHHHLERGRIVCAFTLLVDHLELTPLFKKFYWYESIPVFDVGGEVGLAKLFGLSKIPMPLIYKPVEKEFFNIIRDEKVPNWPDIAGFVLESIFETAKAMEWLEENSKVKVIKGLAHLIIPGGKKGFKDYSQYLEQKEHIHIVAAVYHNDRGPGWRLYRLDGNAPIDYGRLAGDSRMDFIHTTGFTAGTKERIPLEEVLEMVERSLIPSVVD